MWAKVLLVCAASLAFASGSAFAQVMGEYHSKTSFDLEFWNGTDFDQDRAAGTHPDGRSVAGLPGDGGMYCAPASASSVLGYLTWHDIDYSPRGEDPVVPLDYDWRDDDALTYGKATVAIETMGERMGTDASDGTGPLGMYFGMEASIDLDDFDLYAMAAPYWVPTVPDMASYMSQGGLIYFAFGRYDTDDDRIGLARRESGHIMVFAGGTRGAGYEQEAFYYNPGWGSDPDEQSQSDFHRSARYFETDEWRFSVGLGRVKRDYSELFYDGRSTHQLIDGAVILMPEDTTVSFTNPSGVTASVSSSDDGGSGAKASIVWDSGQENSVGEIRIADLAELYDARFAEEVAYSSPIEAIWVVVDGAGRRRLVWTNYSSGASRQIGEPTFEAMSFATSRFGELFARVGNEIRYFNTSARPLDRFEATDPDLVMELPPGPYGPLLDIAYDDGTDRLILLTGGLHPSVTSIDRTLDPRTLAPPSELITLAGHGQMELAVSSISDAIYVLSHQEGRVVEFMVGEQEFGLPAIPTAELPLAGELRNLQVDEQGHVFLREGGAIRHYAIDQHGLFQPQLDSPRWDMASDGAFAVTISRHALVEGIHDRPEWGYHESGDDSDARAVPEPSGVLALAVGMAALLSIPTAHRLRKSMCGMPVDRSAR